MPRLATNALSRQQEREGERKRRGRKKEISLQPHELRRGARGCLLQWLAVPFLSARRRFPSSTPVSARVTSMPFSMPLKRKISAEIQTLTRRHHGALGPHPAAT